DGWWPFKFGVIALMPSCKGDVVCDYHGTYISEAEGKLRPQSGYLFFFRDKCDRGMCIDATAFPCACHPDIETYGTILFIALKDITVGEELLWDYGCFFSFFLTTSEGLQVLSCGCGTLASSQPYRRRECQVVLNTAFLSALQRSENTQIVCVQFFSQCVAAKGPAAYFTG
uniref:SET domain-containing protein n=1 Tax=Neolamprologus brichardi TaxID=32507 RepID=A0A3Q4GEQ5_NEOBR